MSCFKRSALKYFETLHDCNLQESFGKPLFFKPILCCLLWASLLKIGACHFDVTVPLWQRQTQDQMLSSINSAHHPLTAESEVQSSRNPLAFVDA